VSLLQVVCAQTIKIACYGPNEKVAAAALRAAKLKVEATRQAARAVVVDLNRRNVLRSSVCVEKVAQAVESGYREICHAAAVAVAEIEGEHAPRHSANLTETLRELQPQVLEIYQQHASASGMKQRVDSRRVEIQKALDEMMKGTVADLELGIAGGVNIRKQKSGVSIDNRGGSGQFIFDSPKASQVIGRDQVSSGNIDPRPVMDLLRQVREEVAKLEVVPEARAEIEDALVNAEREIAWLTPDSNRTLRLLRALGTRLEQVGIGVAASLVASYLQGVGP
jgi:hypothetical protein